MNVENKNRRKQSNGEKNLQEHLGLATLPARPPERRASWPPCQPARQNVGPSLFSLLPPVQLCYFKSKRSSRQGILPLKSGICAAGDIPIDLAKFAFPVNTKAVQPAHRSRRTSPRVR